MTHAMASAAALVKGVEGLLLGGGKAGVEPARRFSAALEGLLMLGHALGLAVEALGRGQVLGLGAGTTRSAAHPVTHAFGRGHGGQEGLQGGLLVAAQLQHGAQTLGPALLHGLTMGGHLGRIHSHVAWAAAGGRRGFGWLGQGGSGDA